MKVTLRAGESAVSLIKRFNRDVMKSGLIRLLKAKAHFKTNREKREGR